MRYRFPLALGAVIVTSTLGLGAQTPSSAPAPKTQPPATQPKSTRRRRVKNGDERRQPFRDGSGEGSMAEVELGQLAADKASNAKVKEFGQRMVTDHGKAGDELKTLAASKNITLPTAINAKQQGDERSSFEAFRNGVRSGVHGRHGEGPPDGLVAFHKEATSGHDTEIKAWARQDRQCGRRTSQDGARHPEGNCRQADELDRRPSDRGGIAGFRPDRIERRVRHRISIPTAVILEQFYLKCLAHASYLIGDPSSQTAIIVDPQRDVGVYVEAAARHGLQIRGVFLTHFHADFLAGHLELRKLTGATIYLGARARAEYAFTPMADGDRLPLGRVRLDILETPGHTIESISILVFDLERDAAHPYAVLTGDTLFIGDVGRPDLRASVGWAPSVLARMLYHSLHDKLLRLPDATLVYPAHGAGSLCGRNLSPDIVATLGDQRAYELRAPRRR